MGHFMRNGAFKHGHSPNCGQNAQIQFILCMNKVSSGFLLSIHSFCSMFLLADSGGPDKTAWMCRLNWAFFVCMFFAVDGALLRGS